jgi:membrane protease YdiL (CAAX protease family)
MKRLAVPLAAMAASAASLFLSFTVLKSAIAGFVLYHLLCCIVLPAADFLVLKKASPRSVAALLGFRKPWRRDLALGLGLGAFMAAVMILALSFLRAGVFESGKIHEALGEWGVSGRNMVLVYIVMIAFNGAVEELFWRGYLYERLRFLPNRFLALGLPAFFFGAQHLFVISRLVADPALIALFLLGILGAGAVWSVLREHSAGILPCLVSHVMVTAGYMGALFFFSP